MGVASADDGTPPQAGIADASQPARAGTPRSSLRQLGSGFDAEGTTYHCVKLVGAGRTNALVVHRIPRSRDGKHRIIARVSASTAPRRRCRRASGARAHGPWVLRARVGTKADSDGMHDVIGSAADAGRPASDGCPLPKAWVHAVSQVRGAGEQLYVAPVAVHVVARSPRRQRGVRCARRPRRR